MDVILASNNSGKIREFKDILKNYHINVLSLSHIGFNDEIVEDGKTFMENALIKAKTISKKYNCITIADDSGICVEALNNEPGIYSARYAHTRNDIDNNNLLLKNLGNNKNRRAFYECSIVVYFPNDKYYHYNGVCYGKIGYEPIGDKGFGYDPLFYPDGFDTTFGIIDSVTKNKISHRGKAIMAMMKDASILFREG